MARLVALTGLTVLRVSLHLSGYAELAMSATSLSRLLLSGFLSSNPDARRSRLLRDRFLEREECCEVRSLRFGNKTW